MSAGVGPSFTTLPPIFAARPAHSGGRRGVPYASARGHAAPLSPRIHDPRKPPLPQFKQPVRGAGGRGDAALGSLSRPGTHGGGGSAGNGIARARASPQQIARAGVGVARGGPAGGKVASLKGGTDSARGGGGVGAGGAKAKALLLGGSSDEAEIAADGTVTFGPNLTLVMSSLAVRFDDTDADGNEGDGVGGGGARGRGGKGARGGAGGGGGGGEDGSDGAALPSGLSLLAQRKKAEKKKKEWSAMQALYAQAMEDKQSSREAQGQAQWFAARFQYPIAYTPQHPQQQMQLPPGAAAIAAAQQMHRTHAQHVGGPAPLSLPPASSSTAAGVGVGGAGKQDSTHAVMVEEGDVEEEEAEDEADQ